MKTSVSLYFFGRRLFVGVCLAIAFSALGQCTAGDLTLLPDNPSGLVGEDMSLNCTLSNKTLHWQDLVFSMAYYSNSKHHWIPATDVRHLSDWSAEVTVRNLTDKHHWASIFCRYDNRFAVSQMIVVGRRPAVPKIDYCRYLDWKEFVFRWKIRPSTNGFNTVYNAWFKSSLQLDFTPCDVGNCSKKDKSNCPYQDSTTCHIPETYLKPCWYDGFLHFKVNATNIAGTATSDNISAYFYNLIEPGPVTELEVFSTYDKNVGKLVDILRFLPPREQQHFTYEIHLTSTENPKDHRRFFEIGRFYQKRKTTSIIVKDVNPFTVYNLSIRSNVNMGETNHIIWSKWSNVTFASHEEVPLKSPDVCQSCFEVDENSIERTARIYFKPLTKEESRGKVSYDVNYEPTTVKRSALSSSEDIRWYSNDSGVDNETDHLVSNSNVIANESTIERARKEVRRREMGASFVRLVLLKSVPYRLNLYAETKAGPSPMKSTKVFIPTQAELLRPPANCSVMSVDGNDENRVVFRWNNPPPVDGHGLKYVTVFWCKAFLNSMICNQPLNWLELDARVASIGVNLTDSYEGYLFGIGQVLENGHSSGIHWTCAYFKKDAVASPPNLIPLEIDETKVVIKLDKPKHNPKEGLIYAFNLYYSPVDSEGRQQETKIYIEDWKTKGVVAIEGLKRGTSYKFKAEALTTAGSSYTNASVTIVTKPFQLDGHALGWIIFGAVVIGIFALVGFSCCIRFWMKLKSDQLIRRIQHTLSSPQNRLRLTTHVTKGLWSGWKTTKGGDWADQRDTRRTPFSPTVV